MSTILQKQTPNIPRNVWLEDEEIPEWVWEVLNERFIVHISLRSPYYRVDHQIYNRTEFMCDDQPDLYRFYKEEAVKIIEELEGIILGR
jgi:hypothetical protein